MIFSGFLAIMWGHPRNILHSAVELTVTMLGGFNNFTAVHVRNNSPSYKWCHANSMVGLRENPMWNMSSRHTMPPAYDKLASLPTPSTSFSVVIPYV